MTEEFGFERPEDEVQERIKKMVEAVAFAIDTSHIENGLPDDLEWSFDEVGPEGKPGRITIAGYRDSHNDDGVEIVMQIKHVDFGPHRLSFEEESDGEDPTEGESVNEEPMIVADMVAHGLGDVRVYSSDGQLVSGTRAGMLASYIRTLSAGKVR